MHIRHQDSVRLIQETLQDQGLRIELLSFQIEESMDEDPSRILATIKRFPEGELVTLEGAGVGAFDAFFVALKDRLSPQFPSLKLIRFAGIKLRSVPGSDREHPTDAEAEVTLRFQNAQGQDYYFTSRSWSMLRANMDCILRVVEFFVNSELALQVLQGKLQQAQQNNDRETADTLQEQIALLAAHIARA